MILLPICNLKSCTFQFTLLEEEEENSRRSINFEKSSKGRMSRGVMAAPQSFTGFSTSRIQLVIRKTPLFPSNLNPSSSALLKIPRISYRCKSSGDSAPIAGDNESKIVMDAFFLGKAVGEALNERIESGVGEFLSVIGRLQAEQQKHVSEFREDVLEKARRAKEEASKDALSTSTPSVVSDEDPLLGMLFKD